MVGSRDDGPVRILHLSDIHMRAKSAWDADPLLRALTDFIAADVAAGMVPDLVTITGDLAFSGKKAEYDLARTWLDELWPKLGGLDRDRLLLVPGNHDVDRGKVTKAIRMVQDALLKAGTQDEIAELLKDKDSRSSLLKRHAAYLAFARSWFGRKQPFPWWQRVLDIRGTTIHVAGLDSAWMSFGDQDRGRLLLGRWQVNQTVLAPGAKDTHWRLALVHHPWDYLAEFEHEEIPGTIQRHARGHGAAGAPA